MITAPEAGYIASHAHVPEHLPGYVTAISSAEPYLIDDYLCYRGAGSIVFVGYPLQSHFDEVAMMAALEAAIARFAPEWVALTAPAVSMLGATCRARESDRYYRLDLSQFRLTRNVEGMIRRASRELNVESGGRIEEEHTRLIAEFLGSRQFGEEARTIFENIPAYVSSVSSARIFSARDSDGHLVAFDVAEFGAENYAFYQFNFRSRTHYVPGASDLLFSEMVNLARECGKTYIHLGLGVTEGIRAFKRKWGGVPSLRYEFFGHSSGRLHIFESLASKL